MTPQGSSGCYPECTNGQSRSAAAAALWQSHQEVQQLSAAFEEKIEMRTRGIDERIDETKEVTQLSKSQHSTNDEVERLKTAVIDLQERVDKLENAKVSKVHDVKYVLFTYPVCRMLALSPMQTQLLLNEDSCS